MSSGTDNPTGDLPGRGLEAAALTGWPAAILLATAWFALTLPLLGRSEWEDDMETLNVATALESKWSGNYFVPTLQAEPRLNKPPLLPWLTAASISQRTAADLDNPDDATRWTALWRLAFEARLPTHVMAALLLLATYGLGRATCSARCGLVAAAVCATMLLFTRYARFASFDVPLALFTAAGQFFLAQWLFHGRRWQGAIGGGLALGLGILSKGPVILLFTAAPVLLYMPLRRRLRAGDPTTQYRAGPIIALVFLTVLPSLPWVMAVAGSVPGVWSRWYAEISRRGATAAPSGKWYSYVVLLRLGLPWTAWIVAGGVLAWRDFRARHDARGAVLILVMVLLPLVVMSLARDRKPHYLLPLLAPLAVMAARGLDHHRREYPNWDAEAVVVFVAHWLALLGLAAAVLVNSDASNERLTAASVKAAWPALAALAVLAAAGIALHRRHRTSIVLATVLVMALVRGVEGSRPPVVPVERLTLRAVARQVWNSAPPDARVFIHDTSGVRPLAVQPAAEFELLLGRTVLWTPEPKSLPPGPGPMALIRIHRTAASTQPADLADWSSVGRWTINKLVYEVLVPEAQRRAFVFAVSRK